MTDYKCPVCGLYPIGVTHTCTSELNTLTHKPESPQNGRARVENDELSTQAARIIELEARYEADLAQFPAYQRRVDELEAVAPHAGGVD